MGELERLQYDVHCKICCWIEMSLQRRNIPESQFGFSYVSAHHSCSTDVCIDRGRSRQWPGLLNLAAIPQCHSPRNTLLDP